MNSGEATVSIDVALLVKREQALTLVRNMRTTLALNCVVSISVGTLLWAPSERFVVSVWIACVLIVNALRLLSVVVAEKSRLIETDPARVLQISWAGALACGCVWGVLMLWAFHEGQLLHPAIGFVICGLCAGAVVLGPTHRATVWAFVLPILVTHFVGLMATGTIESFLLAFDVFLFVLMLYRSSTHAERAFKNVSGLKHEATGLAVSLKQANDVATVAVKRLEYLANHDPLTGLANRTAFNLAFSQSLEEARLTHCEVAVMLIDLDRFKAINDTFGHATGDQVLIDVAGRLSEKLDKSSLAARLGGDEFAVILKHPDVEALATSLASSLIDSICKPITINERQLSVGASAGFSLYPRDGYSVEELQISADVALYAAKSGGRGVVRAFDERLRAATDARRVYELDLADAIADNSLEVWFQPQISLRDHRLCGLESLIRWNHPNHGWVPPPDIVNAAVATRQSEALTGFVVAASCRMIRALTLAGRNDVCVSFNASPKELGRYSLADLIGRALAAQNVEPERLEVEITEEAMFSEENGGADLRAISAMGVKIAVDDFGVGYSSFGALRALKFDCIKIDRVFVEGVTDRADDRALVQAILGVARALGVKTIAEGVETAEQLAVLTSLGCNEVQGYYFAKPMPAKKVLEWMANHAAAGSRADAADQYPAEAQTPITRVGR